MNDMETRSIKLQYCYLQSSQTQLERGSMQPVPAAALYTRESAWANGISDSDVWQSIVLYIPPSGCHYIEAIKKDAHGETIDLFYPHHYPVCRYEKSGKKEE